MLTTNEHGAVLEIRIDHPPANALTPDLMRALAERVRTAGDGDHRALVLSGAPGMFSAGLDVPLFLELDRPGVGQAWLAFFDVMRALVSSPVPIACAITGHAPAGGCVLALCCDWRVMAEGRFKVGLNEVAVGVRVPRPVLAVARHTLGRRQAERMCTEARLVGPDEALAMGLVDALAPADDVLERAVAWAQDMAALPPQTLRHTRQLTRREVVRALERIEEETIEQFLDEWFSDEAQGALRALVERLRK